MENIVSTKSYLYSLWKTATRSLEFCAAVIVTEVAVALAT